MKKKFLTVLLLALLLCLAAAPAMASLTVTYQDAYEIDGKHYAAETLIRPDENTVEKLTAAQLYSFGLFQGTETEQISGYEQRVTLALERQMSRAEAVTMLVRLLGAEEAAKSGEWELPFADVAEWIEKKL